MILVVFLAAAWAVILGPVLLRRRSERGRGSVNSISHFHRQLRILEHAAPEPIVVPAYRLRAVRRTDDRYRPGREARADRGRRRPAAASGPGLPR